MNRLSALQHAEDMRLDQHIEIASRDPSFVATLPFDQNSIKRYITDRILHRTRRRWAWFVKARETNPSLGTLSHLPVEIRQNIWRSVLHCRNTLSSDGLWEYEGTLGSVLSPSAYYFGFGRRPFIDSNIENLRLVSSSVKEEYDDIFFKMPFRFNQASNLTQFLDRLTDSQLTQLASVEIGVCTLYNVEGWMTPVSRLPPKLREIHFRIYPTIPNWYEGKIGQKSLEQLGKLIQNATERVPDARVLKSSTDEKPLSAHCQAVFDDVFGLEEEKIENPFEVRRCDAQVKGALEFLDDAE